MTQAVALDDRGLVPAVIQDRLTGQVRMLGWMNREALQRTLQTRRCTFFSRSRNQLWEKGETSGHTLTVCSVALDCDHDTLLVQVEPLGPTCHTGRVTCFFRDLDAAGAVQSRELEPTSFLHELEHVIQLRTTSNASTSYTKQLLDQGTEQIGRKLREEAAELAEAIASESDERVAAEAADLLYHVLVALRARELTLREVLAVLASRSGTSGLDEKAARTETKKDDPDEHV
jgi:phosphoribosyl-ATP pyrophosphohydrolase/phosphoribosyl-AMP cyclohydrolase